jgi:2-haloacid dehalogenase
VVTIGIGIDVYGTLVDPLEVNVYLKPLVGDLAERVAELWRGKQLEYTFRRAAMGRYENFDVCSKQALAFTLETLGIELAGEDQQELLGKHQHLSAYADAVPALRRLAQAGSKTVAFSNGVETTLRRLLQHAGITPHLQGIISVDDLKTFKPDPRVYFYLAQRLRCAISDTWLVSSNPFDVIGAKWAGLKAAWIKRKADSAFDPWDVQPDLITRNLVEFAERLREFVSTPD